MISRRLDTEENRAFWLAVDRAAERTERRASGCSGFTGLTLQEWEARAIAKVFALLRAVSGFDRPR